MNISATFLGVGSASAIDLGNASLSIEVDDKPWLLIDCGFDTVSRFVERYNTLPKAVFITHCHFDHIGGLEQLYFQSRFTDIRPVVYVPSPIIPTLTNLLKNTLIAEGAENVWDILNLVPIHDAFFHEKVRLYGYPVRHHAPNSAFSLHMPGYFFYSGDTRPIPEIVHHHVNNHEIIFHDCGLASNPSHTGLDDLYNEYSPSVLKRMVVYHSAKLDDAEVFKSHNIACAYPNQRFKLPSVMSNHLHIQLSHTA